MAMALSEKITALLGDDYLAQRAKRGSREKFLKAMSKVPDVPPANTTGSNEFRTRMRFCNGSPGELPCPTKTPPPPLYRRRRRGADCADCAFQAQFVFGTGARVDFVGVCAMLEFQYSPRTPLLAEKIKAA